MGVSHWDRNMIMNMFTIIFTFICKSVDDTTSPLPQQTLNQWPTTIKAIVSKFKIEGKTSTCVVCPECHANYAPLSGPNLYPQTCMN